MLKHPTRRFVALVTAVLACLQSTAPARACPFCSAVSLTFSQEIAQSEVAVIGRLVKPPPPGSLMPGAQGPLPKAGFEVVEVLKGAEVLEAAGYRGEESKPIETIFLDEKPVGSLFLLLAVEPPKLVWSSPIAVSDKAVAYLRDLGGVPEKGGDRLAFFQRHLEDPDEVLARDAYDEFAIAPYADLKDLEDRMDASQLLEWIETPSVQPNRRRLYATMLGVCGTRGDASRIAAILRAGSGQEASEDAAGPLARLTDDERREVRSGLDALIACYVTLLGEEGLDLVDRLFLDRAALEKQGREVPFTETYAAVMALRFLGEESGIVPRERVLASLRLLLAEPKLADLVIADLARWEDWSVVDRLGDLFRDAADDTIFVREPVVNYLRACPLPRAAEVLALCESIDPQAVKRATTLAGFSGGFRPNGPPGAEAAPAATDAEPEIAGAPMQSAAAATDGREPSETDSSVPSAASRVVQVIGEFDPTRPEADGPPAGKTSPEAGGGPAVAKAPTAAETGSTAKPALPNASAGGFPAVRWLVWAAVVALVGLVARAILRPTNAQNRPLP
jgi:hypothetical protein